MFNRTLAASLNDFEERGRAGLKKTRQIDALWLAKRFQPYDVRPWTIWIGDEHAKGYLKSDFQVLFSRYIPNSEIDAEDGRLRTEDGPKENSDNGGPKTEGSDQQSKDALADGEEHGKDEAGEAEAAA